MKNAVLLLCGSFNPITFAHLRMLTSAKNYLEEQDFTVLQSIISPVSDFYKKCGLLSSYHRLHMCKLATHDNKHIKVSSWESSRDCYTYTIQVQRHFHNISKEKYGNNVKTFLVFGSDVVNTFTNPLIWAEEDVNYILEEVGLVVIERPEHPIELKSEWREKLRICQSDVIDNISSTIVRNMIKKGKSIDYLTHPSVINYIKKHKLYT